MVIGSSDKGLKVWSSSSGSCLHTLKGHTKMVRSVQEGERSRFVLDLLSSAPPGQRPFYRDFGEGEEGCLRKCQHK